MHLWLFRNGGVALFPKVEELCRPALLVAFADDSSNREVERGEERRGAMAFKLMMSAQGQWRRLDGTNRLPEIIQGIAFVDGIKQLQPVA